MRALAWYDWVGLGGTLLILSAFFLLQAGRIGGTDPRYQVSNAIGSAGVFALPKPNALGSQAGKGWSFFRLSAQNSISIC